MDRSALLLLLLAVTVPAAAQRTGLRFVPSWGAEVLVLDTPLTDAAGRAVQVTTLRFLVGVPDPGCATGGHTYHLVDAADSLTWDVALPAPADHFLLGVDSVTSTSGVHGGDLDPTRGMYWAWNSGYINLKVEGTCASLPYPSKEFELHLGGYAAPHAATRRVPLDGRATTVRVDVRALLAQVDLTSRCNVMSPGPEAMRLSDAAVTMFTGGDAH